MVTSDTDGSLGDSGDDEGLDLTSIDGRPLGHWAFDGGGAICSVAIGGTNTASIYVLREASVPAKGVTPPGFAFSITVLDSHMKQVQSVQLQTTTTAPGGLGQPFGCSADAENPIPIGLTTDGRYLVTGAGDGWYVVNTTTFQARRAGTYDAGSGDGDWVLAVGNYVLIDGPTGHGIYQPSDLAPVKTVPPSSSGAKQIDSIASGLGGDWFSIGGKYAVDPAAGAAVYFVDNGVPAHLDLLTDKVVHAGQPANGTDIGDPVVAPGSSTVLFGTQAYTTDLSKTLWSAPSAALVCSMVAGQVAVQVNDQIAVLDAKTGKQLKYSTAMQQCGQASIAGFAWGDGTSFIHGIGGTITSYFDNLTATS